MGRGTTDTCCAELLHNVEHFDGSRRKYIYEFHSFNWNINTIRVSRVQNALFTPDADAIAETKSVLL